MATNALDEILSMEENSAETSMPESSLDDIINFEDQSGDTPTDVPQNPHGAMHTAAEAAGGDR